MCETDELIDSFQTPEEKRLFNLHLRAFRTYRDFMSELQSLFLRYREAIAYITGFTLVWHTYEENEEILNDIIYETKDKKLAFSISIE